MVQFAMEKAWLIPLLPALAFAIIGLLTLRWQKLSALVAIAAILTSFVLAVSVGIGVLNNPELIEKPLEMNVTWFSMEGLNINMGVRIDPISAMMLFVVTLVASLVQIYSLGYMHGDPGFSRFYAYLSLFAASMLGLVISTNLLQMFVFWELVGLCSYLLIGYYYYKISAREAAKKAFITTRIGDFGMLLGILFLQIVFGTLDFSQLAEAVPNYQQYGISLALLNVIAILLFIGPIGKSGQFPLHVWLPDAMEGPTPVSALIHAATMVVAGVYLVGRMLFLYQTAEVAGEVVAWVGGFTAFFAATIALTQTELKRILAYSTVSQLGYMMMALGVGSLTASFFHLFTHAFFKALMFLGAGSVLHAMHGKVHVWDMGGLRKKMPYTAWTFVIGGLAIAGIFPFAGFFSKDEILLVTLESGHTALYWLASITAAMTAFYMWRMIFLTFFGPEKPENHPHESPFSMLLPLFVLAFLSVVGGWVGTPWGPEHGWAYWIRSGEYHHAEANYGIMIVSTILALAGIGLAYLMYLKRVISYEKVAERAGLLYKLSYNKYFIDEIYLWFNHTIVDGLGKLLYWFDIYVIDGIVNGLGFFTRELGGGLRYAQTGRLQNYALVLFLAIVIIAIYLAMGSPAKEMLAMLGGGN
ncbi:MULTISPECIES: NADH-quinone oxidoreductase subunit L [unclassified Carboxydocella]|uniref:NADH-quinone oxidoreductase subunit L n=1 Tax=unclassified Carboxydocella TaxID=2685367 RepID=UPI0009AC4338|nr:MULTISPECIES: NADH-quinone oxidoreductase subunit L [unclassified Carboxydocella]GAW29674.1 NADH-quinone oxidoreductase subunit L [Carboxydocella sp. ULO1]GAW31434.1 NADH-quinone oxidoreductase subunit L [Carboxydocella sp. JDF658]